MATETAVVDLTEALDRVDGDRALYFELVEGFMGEFDGYRSQLEDAVTKGDHKSFQAVVHTIKGVLGNLSAKRAYEIALEMDLQCKAGAHGQAEGSRMQLYQAVTEFFSSARDLETRNP